MSQPISMRELQFCTLFFFRAGLQRKLVRRTKKGMTAILHWNVLKLYSKLTLLLCSQKANLWSNSEVWWGTGALLKNISFSSSFAFSFSKLVLYVSWNFLLALFLLQETFLIALWFCPVSKDKHIKISPL